MQRNSKSCKQFFFFLIVIELMNNFLYILVNIVYLKKDKLNIIIFFQDIYR